MRLLLEIAAICLLLHSCGAGQQEMRECESMYERMDSLGAACRYAEVLAVGDTLLARLDGNARWQDGNVRCGAGRDSLRSEVLNWMGMANFRLGNMDEAVRYQQQCYDIDRTTGDADLMSSDLNQLAAYSLQAGQHELARDYIVEAIRVEEPLGRDDVLAIRYGLASEIFLKLNDYAQAEDYACRALDIDRRAGRDVKVGIRLSQLAAVIMADTLACDGIAGHSDRQPVSVPRDSVAGSRRAEAQQALLEAVPLLQAAGNINSLSIVHCQLGELALMQHTSAGNHFETALDLCAQTGNKFIEKRALQGLWRKLRSDNPALGATYLERYTTLSDSLVSAQAVSHLNSLRVQYATRELRLDNERLAARGRLHSVIAIALAVIVLMLVAFIFTLRHSRRSKLRLMRHMENVRTSFFTNITHEFRTPLTVILGLSDSIAAGKMEGDELRKAASVITAQGNGLLGLVNQLLDISKVKSEIGTLDWRRGNIVSYIHMVVETYAQYAQRGGIDMRFSPAENVITMDFVPDYIHKVMHNLISNALKFTPKGGYIYISTNVSDTELTVRVADNGCGIASADLPHIFEPFYQGGNAKGVTSQGRERSGNSNTAVGTGIGLSLSAQMVHAMNGTITVKSVPQKGAVFTIRLPLRHGEQQPLPPGPLPEGEGGTADSASISTPLPTGEGLGERLPLVLIVEDNDSVAYYISSHLADRYQVHYAHNGREGVEKAIDLVPDVVVADLMMPEMDGIAMTELIRHNELVSHVPVIMVTAKADEQEKVRALQAGVDAYIIKPFNMGELLVRIDTLMAQRQLLCEKYQRALQAGNVEGEDMAADDRQFITRFVDVIYALIAKQKSTDLETVAACLNLTSRTLARKVTAITGDTTLLYINKVKVAKAKTMMQADATLPIADVAYRCGFDDPNYFSRIFKQVEGVTPTAFRREKAGD